MPSSVYFRQLVEEDSSEMENRKKIFFAIVLLLVKSSEEEKAFECYITTRSYFERVVNCTFVSVESFDDMESVRSKTDIPSERSIATIAFKDSNVTRFPERAFASFNKLRYLEASSISLQEIAPAAFASLTTWIKIDLSKNELKEVAAKTFEGMTLDTLNLSENLIETIDDGAFTNLRLVNLLLGSNRLKAMNFMNFVASFTRVDLSSNFIENFSFEQKKNGSGIALSLSADVDTSINLRNNTFVRLVFDYNSTVPLARLSLAENPQLVEIDLKESNVQRIDVANCDNLTVVKLNAKVREFSAKNAKMSGIDLTHCKSLTSLRMYNTSLSKHAIETILSFENLTALDLSHNHVGPLNISSFSKLKALRVLGLEATNISNVGIGTFAHQQFVVELDISDNHLGNFNMDAIFPMISLRTLDLSSNDLKTLDNFPGSSFDSLSYVDLSNNEFRCTELMAIMKVFKMRQIRMIKSNVEEKDANIHGNRCVHSEGDEAYIEPLSTDSKDSTALWEKMNEVIKEVGKNTQSKNTVDSRLKGIESRIDGRVALDSVKSFAKLIKAPIVEVKSSAWHESSLTVICVCQLLFLVIILFGHEIRRFFQRSRKIKFTENQFSMNDGEF